jgi:hypothetical protein
MSGSSQNQKPKISKMLISGIILIPIYTKTLEVQKSESWSAQGADTDLCLHYSLKISGISYFSALRRTKHSRKFPKSVLKTRLKIFVTIYTFIYGRTFVNLSRSFSIKVPLNDSGKVFQKQVSNLF